MKKIVFLLSQMLMLSCSISMLAQGKISLDHPDGTSAVYNDLQAALAASQDGDFIYLPGGTYTFGGDTINKSITVIGAGHYPDSTLATNQTIVTGTVIIGNGADNLHLEGLYIAGDVLLSHSNTNYQRADNVMIRRCNFGNLASNGNIYTQNEADTSFSINWQIVQNIIRGDVNFGYLKAFNLHANVVNAHVYYAFWGGTMTNNAFLYTSQSDRVFADVRYCTVKDNIFYTDWEISYPGYACYAPACGSWNNSFLNNMFLTSPSHFHPGIAIADIANIFSVSGSDLFQTYTGGGFSYNSNFTLPSGSPGHNAASDGTDIGLYGSNDPYKASAVPFNPHINYKNIGTSTAPNGMLNVHIKVSSQDR
jgi:hypothetical protein